MRKLSNLGFNSILCGIVIVLTFGAFNAVSLADEPVSAAKKFFDAMSPEQFSDPVALDDYIRRFPDSEEARIAFAYRYSLLEQMPTIEGYNEFIAKYPEKLQAQIAIQKVFELYRYQNRVTGYYDFIKRYPNTQQAIVAMMRIQELMFEYVCKLDKEEEYDAYISAFPDAPQVKAALERALAKAIENERNGFDKYKNEDPKPTDVDIEKTINKKVTDWQREVNIFKKKYPNIDISDKASDNEKHEVRNQLFKIDRRADVLQTLYAEYNATGRIQPTRDNLDIITRLDKINQTLETNQKELLAKLDEETDRICKGLEQLHKDNQQIVETLKNGFALLHKDMVDVKNQLTDIKGTLDKMDRHLEEINRSIIEGFKETNANLEKINNTVKAGFEVQTQLQREQLAELRIQSSRLMDLTLVGANGYNKSDSLWDSRYAREQIPQMNRRFSLTRLGGTIIGKVLGWLAGTATKFVPCVGPYIAPAVEIVTEHFVDKVAIPCVQDFYADITNPNDRRTLSEKYQPSVQKLGTKTVEQLGEALPVVWQEEKYNLLQAAKTLSDKDFPKDLSNAVLNAAGSDSLEEATAPLAEYCGVPKEALTFAAQYIY